MPILLKLKTNQIPSIHVAEIRPTVLRELSCSAIERLEIGAGQQRIACGELFEVTKTGDDDTIRWQGDLESVDRIGDSLDVGAMHIEGDAGNYTGGRMRGGLLHVHGSVSALAGGASIGAPSGMCGGTLLIDGNAGPRLGYRMRRGMIAVAGNTGPLPAADMLAGTIAIGGRCGPRPAAGMRRGTMVLVNCPVEELLPTFHYACNATPLAMRLVVRQLHRFEFELPNSSSASVAIYNGDALCGCRGELWVCQPPS